MTTEFKRGDSQSDNGASEVVCISASCRNTEWDNNHNNKDEDEINVHKNVTKDDAKVVQSSPSTLTYKKSFD